MVESKSSGSESSSSSESGEKKKTVGVRTDVTFEITSGETNDTKTIDEKEIGNDDNASIPIVPVFKGKPDRGSNRVGSNDPKRNPGFNDVWSVKPLDNPNAPNGPNFHTSFDIGNRYGGGNDGWQGQPQYEIWTTERYNHRKYDQPQPPPVYHRGKEMIFFRQ